MEDRTKNFNKKHLLLAASSFFVIVLVEAIIFQDFSPKTNIQSPYQSSNFARFLVKAFVWGGGNFPNLAVILIYSALLDQRHRCFLHLVFYIA